MKVRLCVYGRPAPQGSKRAMNHRTTGRAIMVEQTSKYLKPWRLAVATAARVERLARGVTFDGPLVLVLSFYLERPKTTKMLVPIGPPDLSKLTRAAEDALKHGGLLADDARIVSSAQHKRWATPAHPPGCILTLGSLADFTFGPDMEVDHS